jgi:hypothetical protein
MANSEEDKSSQSVDVIGINLAELKAALLGGIERMEAILQEAESTASHEAQQYEELRQRTEVKVGLLETQLREMEGSLRSKESTINLLKEDLNSKTQELEQLVTEKENLSSLLEKHNSEIALLRSGTEGKVGLLETQLQEMEESLRLKESAINLLEENLTSKIQELNHLVTEKESLSSLLEKHNSAIALLRSETEAKVGLLEAQLQEREKALRKKESSAQKRVLQLATGREPNLQGPRAGAPSYRKREPLKPSRKTQLRDCYSSIPNGGEGWPAGGSAPRKGREPPVERVRYQAIGRELHLQGPRAGAPSYRKREPLKPSRKTQLRDCASQVRNRGEGWPTGGSATRKGEGPPQKRVLQLATGRELHC